MFSGSIRTKKKSVSQLKARRLRVEYLEPRQMLSGNVTAVLGAGQTLNLTALPAADFSDNSIQVWQGPNGGEFWVAGSAGTATLVNSGTAPVQFTNVKNIFVSLGPGSDTFQFLSQGGSSGPGVLGGARSELAANLTIVNSGSGDSNTIQDVKIDGSLFVTKDGTNGRNDLKIIDSIVVASTAVANNAGGANGDSNTTIQGCQLRGPLTITNGTGADIVDIEGSTVGSATGLATVIDNGDGGSRVVFTTYAGTPNASGQTTTTLYGPLVINSGAGFIGVGIADTVVFTGTEVKGPVTIASASGDSKTVIGNPLPGSNLGSDVAVGGAVTVVRGQGFDSFDMESSSAKFGLAITNGVAGQTDGSVTKIVNSQVSTYPPPVGTVGLTVIGDDGADTVTITDSQIGNATVLALGNGDNQVTLNSTALSNTTRNSLTFLTIVTGDGNDSVTIQKTDVTVGTDIVLGRGQDTVNVDYQGSATPTVPLSHLLGVVTINGGDPDPVTGIPPAPETDLLEFASSVVFGPSSFVSVNVLTSP
jgi:hypothetical protein